MNNMNNMNNENTSTNVCNNKLLTTIKFSLNNADNINLFLLNFKNINININTPNHKIWNNEKLKQFVWQKFFFIKNNNNDTFFFFYKFNKFFKLMFKKKFLSLLNYFLNIKFKFNNYNKIIYKNIIFLKIFFEQKKKLNFLYCNNFLFFIFYFLFYNNFFFLKTNNKLFLYKNNLLKNYKKIHESNLFNFNLKLL